MMNKRDITPNSPDVVKICWEGLDSLGWLFTPAQLSSLLLANLNKRKKGGWAATIQDSPYLLPNINRDNYF